MKYEPSIKIVCPLQDAHFFTILHAVVLEIQCCTNELALDQISGNTRKQEEGFGNVDGRHGGALQSES